MSTELEEARRLFTAHTVAVERFLAELCPYLGLDGDGPYKPKSLIEAAADIRQWCADSMDKRGEQQREIERLERLVYLPGHWSCPKCHFYLVSTNLHMASGGFSANDEPQQCANGCGPMWRVTHEQSANTMVDRCDKQQERIEELEAELNGSHS